MITLEQIKENLLKLGETGVNSDDFENEVITAFEDYEFEGASTVWVTSDKENQYQAYVDHSDSPIFIIDVEYGTTGFAVHVDDVTIVNDNSYSIEELECYDKLQVMELELGMDWDATKKHIEENLSVSDDSKERIEEFINNLIEQNVESFIGCSWEDAEKNLKGYITVDKDNVDSETGLCIVDFSEPFNILSIEGKIIDNELVIDDEALIYKNCI